MNIDDDGYPRVNSGTHKVVPVDAIVIERDGLPRVTYDDMDYYVDGHTFPPDWSVAEARAVMRANAAMLVYLRADEVQVERLAERLYDATRDPNDIDVPDVARRLYQAGVRVEVQP